MVKKEVKEFFETLQNTPHWAAFKYKDNSLVYQGKALDLSNFDIPQFLNDNPNFNNEIMTLSPEAIYNILRLHVLVEEEKETKDQMEEKELEEVAEKFPVLKNFHLITNKKENKIKNYIHYTDGRGANFIFKEINAEELIKIYHDLVATYGTGVTEEMILSSLLFQKPELSLESLIEAQARDGASLEHINNLMMLNQRNAETGQTLDTPVGNDEEKIYVSHDMVYTFNLNQDNQLVRENHEVKEGSVEDVSGEQVNEEAVVEEPRLNIITFEEYRKLILSSSELSEEEKQKISDFEKYLFDHIAYKDYLTPELYETYKKYEELNFYLQQLENPSLEIEETKGRFNEMEERSESVELISKETKVQKLIREKDETKMAGNINAKIYIVLIIVLLAILATLFVFITHK